MMNEMIVHESMVGFVMLAIVITYIVLPTVGATALVHYLWNRRKK